jgi:hypothetical protein
MGLSERFFDREARRLLKEAIEAEHLTYKELARRLERLGIHCNDRQLTNRINRGRFSFSFALQVLRALGRDSCPVPKPAKPPAGGAKQ